MPQRAGEDRRADARQGESLQRARRCGALGKGRSQAARRHDAAAGRAAARRGDLHGAASPGSRRELDRAARGASESGPAAAASAQSRRVRQRRSAICSRSTSTPRRCCRRTTRRTASTTSPTCSACRPSLLERYLDGRREDQRAGGRRSAHRRRQPRPIRIRQDLSQDQHIEGLPLGTLGGIAGAPDVSARRRVRRSRSKLFRTNLGIDARPRVSAPARDHGRRRARAPGDDRRRRRSRGARSTSRPRPATRSTRGLRVRVPLKAGPHTIGVAFVEKPRALADTRGCSRSSAARPTRSTATGRPHIERVTITGPFNATGPGDTPSRRAHLRLPPGDAPSATRAAVRRRRFSSTLARRAYRRPVTRRRPAAAARVLSTTGRSEGELRRRHRRSRCGACSRARSSCSASSAIRPASRAGSVYRISDLELASRLSFFLWSSIPGRRAARRSRRRASCTSRRCSSSRCGACSPTRGRRRSSTTSPASGCSCATCRASQPELATSSPTSTTTCARRSSARPSCSSTASCARTAASLDLLTRRLHVRQRAAGAALRHPERLRQPVPPRHARPTTRARGLLGQGSILTRDVARRTAPRRCVRGKWILENLLGTPPPPPPPERAAAQGERRTAGKPLTMRERMERASREPGLRQLPQADGSDRLRARELRRGRRAGATRDGGRADRRVRRAGRRHARSTASSALRAGAAAAAPRCSSAR